MKKLLLLSLFSVLSLSSYGQGATTCSAATTLTTNGNYTIGSITGTYPTGTGLCFTTASSTPNAMWFKFTPTSNGVITIDADIASNPVATTDTRLSVLTGSCTGPWTCVAANDDVDEPASNYRSKLSNIPVTSGVTYYIVWDDRWSSATAFFDFTFTGQTCFVPTGFTFTSAPTTTTAGIGWTPPANGTPTGYQFEYGVRGFTQGTGTVINNTSTQTSVSLSSLLPSTVYEFYIRTDCGSGDYSLWQGPISFNTVFEPTNTPYNTSFEDELLAYIGWFAPSPVTGQGQAWGINAAGAGNATVQNLATSVFSFAGTTANSNVNLISRGLNLQGGQNVNITFWARNFVNPATLTNTGTLELYHGNAQTVAAQTNLIGTQSGISLATFTQYSFNFTPSSTGVYYLSLRNTSPLLAAASGSHAIIVDNFTVTQALTNNEFSNSKFSVYPNPTKGLIDISNDIDAFISSVELSDLNGRVVKTISLGENESQINISELSQGIYLMKIVSDKGIVTKKVIKE